MGLTRVAPTLVATTSTEIGVINIKTTPTGPKCPVGVVGGSRTVLVERSETQTISHNGTARATGGGYEQVLSATAVSLSVVLIVCLLLGALGG